MGDAMFNFGDIGEVSACRAASVRRSPATTAETRTCHGMASGDRAAVAIPANTHYQAGSGDQLVVKGDPAIISHVRVRNGVVGMDCRDGFMHFGQGRPHRRDVAGTPHLPYFRDAGQR